MDAARTRTSLPSRASLPKRGGRAYGPRMRFKVLGPLEAVGDDGPVTLGGPKQRTVLAHLLVRVNELVPADTLIDQVWGDEPPEAARGTLHSYISHLRKALGAERIEGRAPGYVLHAADEELDAASFEHPLHEARSRTGVPPGRARSCARRSPCGRDPPSRTSRPKPPSPPGSLA
jgi:hypothetical protein